MIDHDATMVPSQLRQDCGQTFGLDVEIWLELEPFAAFAEMPTSHIGTLLYPVYDGTPIEWRRSRGRADQFTYHTEIR